MYTDQQLNAKLQAQVAYENNEQTSPSRAYTLSEDAQRNEQFHYEQAAKAGNAARFLSAHPEFDEFIRLVRAGALQF